ncbi:MAG: hypothetical protein IJ673_04020 [Treponema sp.]|nr:hypothetical protein [Treponema sp.]
MKKALFAIGVIGVCALGFIACSDNEDNGCPSGGSYNSASSSSACATAAVNKYGSNAYYCYADGDCYIYASNPN